MDISNSEAIRLSGKFDPKARSTLVIKQEISDEFSDSTTIEDEDITTGRVQTPSPLKQSPRKVPPGVNDFDKENWNELFSVSHYAMDIFEYLKEREVSGISFI